MYCLSNIIAYLFQIFPLPVVSVLNTKVLLSTCEFWYMIHVCMLSCPTLRNPMGYIPPGKNTGVCWHFYSRGSSRPRDWTWISCIGRWILCHCDTSTFQKHQLFGTVFFIIQLSHPYMTTGKTIALTRWIFVGKVMSLLFNMLSGLVKTFLQGAGIFQCHGCSHHLQWSWSPQR